jgi:leucyl-tRNA synthetase
VIANIHEIYNTFCNHINNNKTSTEVLKDEWEKIIMLLLPLIPHLAHECCEKINKKIYWPKYDSKLLKEENATIIIQVNGKKRGMIEMPLDSEEMMVIKKTKEIDNVSKHIGKSTIIKNIYIKNKLVNLITKK